jgi:2-C-methyl-D-erythritol 4-phosphate cytidylyltransferase/2-C-methyl-D-erythritol 2,4-cyclodiphosphate synthase
VSKKPRIAVVIVAAGRGERASASGDTRPKQYRPLAGQPVVSRTIAAFLALPEVDVVLPVIHPDHADAFAMLGLTDPRVRPPVAGRPTRQGSVLAGLEALSAAAPDLVLIQDAARPLATPELIRGVIAALARYSGALPVVPVTDTIKRSMGGVLVASTEDRRTLYAAQTPQGFRYPEILKAHQRAALEPVEFTDDAAIAEWAVLPVALTKGSTRNLKITHPEDFARAERLLRGDIEMETRVGTGFDVHPFEPGDAVWLGGVRIPHSAKLKGHSDADVALHALTDALYGALGLGDIGVHFPPSDPQWRGAASKIFLADAVGKVTARGGRIVNLDLTIVCEAPRVGPHVDAMKAAIGEICGIATHRVGVKATTSEKLGFTGRNEGIVAMASASIEVPRED